MTKTKLIQLNIFFILSLFLNCAPQTKKAIIEKGILDLRSWNFETDGESNGKGIIPLVGEWEFYWNELIENSEERNSFFKKQTSLTTNSISVPSEWQNYELNGNKLPAHGYAMYRVKILFKKGEAPISFSLTDYCSAYKIYVNGISYYQVGQIGKSAEQSDPLLKYGTFSLPIQTPEEMEIVVLISNFHHPKAGMWNKITIGHTNQIHLLNRNTLMVKSLTWGALLIMGAYHLFLYFIRKKDLAPFYFGIFCVITAIRVICMEERFIMEIFPTIHFLILYKLEYILLYLSLPTFLCYIYVLFPNEYSKWFLYPILVYDFFAAIIAIFFPVEYYAVNLLLFFLYGALISIVYTSYVYILAAIRKRPEATLVLVGTGLFYIFVINDLLYGMGIIRTFHLIPYGLLMFTFFQSIMLSQKFSRAFKLSENLALELTDKTDLLLNTNTELNELKTDLEMKVEERTLSLEDAYQVNYSEAKKVYLLEKEIAVQKERQAIFIFMHDHIGSNLLDLNVFLNTLRSQNSLSDTAIQKAKYFTQKLEDNLRMRIHAIEDLEILNKDPLNGIRLLIIRRYAIYEREINFYCEESLYDVSQKNFPKDFVEILFSISQENATNDLKYGKGLSVWKLFRVEQNLCLEIETNTNYKATYAGLGNGRKNISLRIAELNGKSICFEVANPAKMDTDSG